MTHGTRLRAGAVVPLYLAIGCGGATDGNAKVPGHDSLPLSLEHEACDTESSSAKKVDTNGDGKPDIVSVFADGHEVCRMVDLNHDGRADSYVYFDASGAIRRRESDFDRDGRIDEIAYYASGVPIRKDRETNLDGKLDTWDFYEGGKIHHRMRDSDGDGKVDQWWTWPNPDKIECAVIATDRHGNGKPDPKDVVDVCNPGGADAGGNASHASAVAAGSPLASASDAGTALAAAATTDAALALPMSTSVAPLLAGPDAGEAKTVGKARKESQ